MAVTLRHTQAQSERERRRLQTLLDVLPTGVVLADAQGRLLEMNQATTTLWGAEPLFAEGIAAYQQYRGWWASTGQPLAAEDWPLARALIRGEAVLNEEIDLETGAGQRTTILASVAPLRDEAGAITGAVLTMQDLSSVRRLEREVAEQAQELSAIFETMVDGVFVYDAQERVARLNTAARDLLGPEAASQTLLPLEERGLDRIILDENGQPLPLERIPARRILHGEALMGAQSVDVLLSTSAREPRICNVSGKPLRAPDGAITGAVLVARDVTERRRLEREVAERAAVRETIFETITDGIGLLDAQGTLVQTNQAFRALFALDHYPPYLTLPPRERMALLDVRNEQGQPLPAAAWPPICLLQGKSLHAVDLRMKRLDGREIVVNVSGAPIRDARGQILGGVEVYREVTEQHEQAQRIRDALNALVAMGEVLVQVPSSAASGAGAAGQPAPAIPAVDVLAGAEHLAALTYSVLGCQRVSMIAIEPPGGWLRPLAVVGLPPDQEQAWWASWSSAERLEQCFDATSAATLAADEPVRLEATQQPERPWDTRFQAHSSLVTPMRLGEEVVGLLVVDCGARVHDPPTPDERWLIQAIARLCALLLERDQLLQRWTEERARVLALGETKAQMETFLGMASHELKNPLTTLKLSLQLTERRLHKFTTSQAAVAPPVEAPLARVGEQLTSNTHQIERLERLVQDLLDSSRIQAGKLELHLERADLGAIVREAVEAQRQMQPDRTIWLQEPAGRSIPVEADPGRIEQVVTNYLTNALKYSPADRPVTVGIGDEPQQVRVWVKDEGPGVPVEEQERIWERFHRVKGTEVQSGSGIGLGLGLHICRIILERHHGQVGVQSAPGQGATFWFTLPRLEQLE